MIVTELEPLANKRARAVRCTARRRWLAWRENCTRLPASPGFSPSLCCRTNAPADVHLAFIRGTPSGCAEIGGEHQARNYDEPNDEPTHVFSPRAILVAPSEAERRDGSCRGSASAVAIEGERLTSRAMASDRIGHHSNLLTYSVPNSSMHWPPKKTNSFSMPTAARTVHLEHGMAISRICAGNRSIFQHGIWVVRNRPPRASLPLDATAGRKLTATQKITPYQWCIRTRRGEGAG